MAKANIEKLMQMLDPEECAKKYELPNLMAREAYRLAHEKVETFDQMMEICQQYYLHHFSKVISQSPSPSPEMTRGVVWGILEHHYKGGVEASFKAAAKGLNGGFPGVLDAIRDYFLKEQETQYFDYTVMEGVDVMDLDDIQTLMQQYVERYGRYIDGANMPTAAHLVPKYREVIRAHANVVRNIRTHFSR